MTDIIDVAQAHAGRLMGRPGVVGVGVGQRGGEPVIVVSVLALTPELVASLPARLDGHAVVVELTAELRPQGGGG
jgi:hypothetical protein